MSDISIVLTSIFFMLLLLYLAPSVIAMNRGKMMQNIALWLMVFVGLGLIYKNFGPESENPMFTMPEGMRPFNKDFMAEKKAKAEEKEAKPAN